MPGIWLLLLLWLAFPPQAPAKSKRELALDERAHRMRLLWQEASRVRNTRGLSQPLRAPTSVVFEQVRLLGSERETYDRDGGSVAISGDTILIGGDGDAFVFVRAGPGWVLQARLVPNDRDFIAFGRAVALDGNTALVGAWLADGATGVTGAAFVFVRNGAVWTQQSKIAPADGKSGDGFGYSVALSGGTALIGAPDCDAQRGAAYVFTRSGSAWSQQAKLIGSGSAAEDAVTYTKALSIDGDTAVVGSWRKELAWVFVRNAGVWTEQARLAPALAAIGFGRDLAIHANTIVASSGHVFERDGSGWTERASFSGYTTAVAISGSRILSGIAFESGVAEGTGAAFIHNRSGTGWSEGEKLIASDGLYSDTFGDAVAISGTTAVVGAPYDDDIGSAYVFELGSVPQDDPATAVGLRFVPLKPCRVMETRAEYNFEGRTGAFGPPFLNAGESRTLTMPASSVCQVPPEAKAYVLNVTVVPRGSIDFLTVWPGGDSRPNFWTVRSPDGLIVANSAIVKPGAGGTVQVFASHSTDVLMDISGYFTDASPLATNVVYYPMAPCRLVETRALYRPQTGEFGPPSMQARQTRHFRLPGSPHCAVPQGAVAYSVTLTAIPPRPLAFLTAWPSGQDQPNVSTMNSPAGRILANSAIVPAGQNGSIDVYAFNETDILVDINGYFAVDDGVRGLYYFPVRQCRANDSRVGPIYEDGAVRTIPLSVCAGIPSTAAAYAVNVTAMPGGSPMPFITVYPAGQGLPNTSVLNAFEGQVVTNSTIVPAGSNGAINVFVFRKTHVAVEVSGYFGR